MRSWNGVAAELTGYEEREALGRRLDVLFEEERESGSRLGAGHLRAAASGGRTLSLRARPRPRPEARLALSVLQVGRGRFAVLLSAAASEADESAALLTSAWGRLQEGMALASSDDDPEGPRILATNDAFGRMFGVRQDEVRGRPLASRLDPGNGPEVLARIRAGVADGFESISDRSFVRRGGETALIEWEVIPVRSGAGGDVGFVSIQRDVTGASVRENARAQPAVDPLTGLPNRDHFLSRLSRSLEHAARKEQSTFAVIGLEFEDLGAIRRNLGAAVGHSVLEAASWRARECLRPGDLVARVGEHRLALLVDHLGPWGEVEHILARVRLVLEAPYMVGRERIALKAVAESVPVWSNDRLPADAQEVMDEVELGLWRAEPRRGRTSGADGGGYRASPLALPDGLSTSHLSLRYHPIVSLDSGRVVGLEALVRWEHPERGVLTGRDVVPDAQRAGLMGTVGRWVLEQACRQVKDWAETLPPQRVVPVHVNVSGAELWQGDVADLVERLVRELALDPGLVRLEVPEEAFTRGRGVARDVLKRLDAMGVELWLDDFGREGVPLGDLPELPVRRLKLSPSLWWCRQAGRSRASPLLQGLVGLAHDLGWRVAATQVETSDQRDVLRELNCDFAQGFFFSTPVDSAGAVELLEVDAMPRV